MKTEVGISRGNQMKKYWLPMVMLTILAAIAITLWRTEKVHRHSISESADCPAPGYGGEGAAHPQGLCRSTAACRIYSHRDRLQLKTYFGGHVGLGCWLSGKKCVLRFPAPQISPHSVCRSQGLPNKNRNFRRQQRLTGWEGIAANPYATLWQKL